MLTTICTEFHVHWIIYDNIIVNGNTYHLYLSVYFCESGYNIKKYIAKESRLTKRDKMLF